MGRPGFASTAGPPVRASALLMLGLGFLLIACSPPADQQSVPPGTDRIVKISMEGMHFVPDKIEVKAGELVAFVVTNPTDVAHELFIGTEADQAAHAMVHMAASSGGQANIPHDGYGIYLAPHAIGMVSYRFDIARRIMLGCHLPGHWEAGMHALVTVEP